MITNGKDSSFPVLVAIGGNLPGPAGATALDTCRRAVGELARLPGLRLVGLSRWYRTAPMPPSGQPDYVNAVAHLGPLPGHVVDPAALLAALLAIEARHGRERSAANAARTLDLDLIAVGGIVREFPDPILPHPRAHQRAFVLAPLADVAPGWLHPVLHRTAAALLAALPDQGVEVMSGA